MGWFDGTRREGSGSLFGLIANLALLLGIASVATGLLLDRLTSGPDAPLTALLSPHSPDRQYARTGLRPTYRPPGDDLDRTPTASIRQPLVINPCAPKTN